MTALDHRLRAFAVLIVVGLGLHGLRWQSVYRAPWEEHLRWAFDSSPGWHLIIPNLVRAAIVGAVVIAMGAVALTRSRESLMALSASVLLDYLTFPTRTPNHLTLLVTALVTATAIMVLGRRWGGVDDRVIDGRVVKSVAAVLVVGYWFAGFHKLNSAFLSGLPAESSAVEGLALFFRNGGLHPPPRALGLAVSQASIAIECFVPLAAVLLKRLRPLLILLLIGFHFPQLTALGAFDYPIIAFAFYPLIFEPAQWRYLERQVKRPSASMVVCAAAVVLLHWQFSAGGTAALGGTPGALLWGLSVLPLLRLARQLRLRKQRLAYRAIHPEPLHQSPGPPPRAEMPGPERQPASFPGRQATSGAVIRCP